MSTDDKRLRIYDKAFISTLGLGQHFFDFLQKFTADGFTKIWPDSGIFGATGILSSAAIDTFSCTALEGIWNHGKLCNLGVQTDIPFENQIGFNYYIGALFNEIPDTCTVNPLTGNPEYIYLQEAVGEKADPDAVYDDGDGTLTIVVNSVTEVGVTNVGRMVTVWLTIPETSAPGWYENCVVQYGDPKGWGGNKNYIETSGSLGQGTISVLASDYKVFLNGLSCFRNKDLSDRVTYPEYIYLGYIVGNGPAMIPTVFVTAGVTIYGSLSGGLLTLPLTGIAGENLSAFQPVYVSGSETVSRADANAAEALSRVIGLTLTAALLGNPVLIARNGAVVDGALAGATPGTPYYLSTVLGTLTTTPPTGAGTYQVQVGIAWSPTALLVQIHDFTSRWTV